MAGRRCKAWLSGARAHRHDAAAASCLRSAARKRRGDVDNPKAVGQEHQPAHAWIGTAHQGVLAASRVAGAKHGCLGLLRLLARRLNAMTLACRPWVSSALCFSLSSIPFPARSRHRRPRCPVDLGFPAFPNNSCGTAFRMATHRCHWALAGASCRTRHSSAQRCAAARMDTWGGGAPRVTQYGREREACGGSAGPLADLHTPRACMHAVGAAVKPCCMHARVCVCLCVCGRCFCVQ